VSEAVPGSRRIPRATYRLQLHASFTFSDVRRVLPYLDALGVSDVYLSPILAATPGSTHGYDVVDPTIVAPLLGGVREFRQLAAEVRERGMGILLDIVPNHLGIASEANRWWFDVLRHGKKSDFAPFFDIDWEPPDPALHGRVLLPVLGAELEDALRRGELTVERDADGPHLRYFDRRFPVDPTTALDLDARAIERLNDNRTSREGGQRLRDLLDRQHYALAYWRTAAREVNYRRFFTIDGLVGVRVEDERVFEATHATVLELVKQGDVTGLRVDHIDGLADPEQYLSQLRDRAGSYVVVEKILAFDEELPPTWKTDGTTGYEFMNDVTGLLVHSGNVPRFHGIYAAFTGREEPFADIAYRARRAVIDGPLSQQVDLAATALFEAAGVVDRDVDLEAWLAAVRGVLACLPVYRLYVTDEGLDPEAPRHLAVASAEAADRLLDVLPAALAAVVDVFAQPPPGPATHEVMRLQQLMPAIRAKGVEDAAIYRHVALLPLDEVGSDPERPGLSIDEFHERAERRLERWRGSLLATATHDHKRGAGIRARLAALSELPDEWERAIEAWSQATQQHLEHPPGPDSPSRHDEYVIFQTVLGAWPLDASVEPREDLVARLTEYMVKAAREAGERTTWADPAEAYEAALGEFVEAATRPEVVGPLLEESGSLGRRTAWLGALNGLSQTLLKLTAPGLPDIYQGTELWDLSLVDPDNRRPVDYGDRLAMLERLDPLLEDTPAGDRGRSEGVSALLANWESGAVKLFLLARGLRLRRRLEALFAGGEYRALEVIGARRSHALAFERRLEGHSVIAIATLQPAGLLGPLQVAKEEWAADWADTALVPGPATDRRTSYLDALTGTTFTPSDSGALPLQDLLRSLPVALLERHG